VDNETDTIRLLHYTLQEYLDSPTKPIFPKGHADIARTCFLWCKFKQFNIRSLNINYYQDYAAAWQHHTQLSKTSLPLIG
jgi:hypothetical protein